MEYACNLTQHKYINLLEKVQRRTVQFVYRDYSRESSVSDMFKNLDWLLLSMRHECFRLNFMYKASVGLNAIDPNVHLTLPNSVTHGNHEFKHEHLLVHTDVFKYSYFTTSLFQHGIHFPQMSLCPRILTDLVHRVFLTNSDN